MKNKCCCYIPRLSLNKTSTVIGHVQNMLKPVGLMTVNEEVVLSLFLLCDLLKGKFKCITKHLMYGPSGNQLVFFSLKSLKFPRTKSW